MKSLDIQCALRRILRWNSMQNLKSDQQGFKTRRGTGVVEFNQCVL